MSANVLVSRGAADDPSRALPDLTVLDCMRDVKLVCQDGVVEWNAVMLCQWSQVMRDLMKEGGPAVSANPTTVILPEVESSVLNKLLRWSSHGEVLLNSSESQKVLSTLHAFGPRVQFSQQPHFGGDRDPLRVGPDVKYLARKSPPQQHIKEIDSKANLEPLNKKTKEENSRPRKPPHNAGKGVWKCPCCHATGKIINALICHVSRAHFRQKLMDLWRGDLEDACRICSKAPFNNRNKNLSTTHKEYLICDHLAVTHGKIFEVADEKVLEALRGYKQKRMALQRNPKAFSQCMQYFAAKNKSCGTCKNSLASLSSLIYHLAFAHHYEELLEVIGGSQERCGLCHGKELTSKFGGGQFNVVRHVVAYHKERLYDLLPTEGVRLLELCKGRRLQLQQAQQQQQQQHGQQQQEQLLHKQEQQEMLQYEQQQVERQGFQAQQEQLEDHHEQEQQQQQQQSDPDDEMQNAPRNIKSEVDSGFLEEIEQLERSEEINKEGNVFVTVDEDEANLFQEGGFTAQEALEHYG